MKKIKNLSQWQLDKGVSNAKRYIDVSINFKYPDQKLLFEFKPKERIKKINLTFKADLKELIGLNLFATYELVGTKKRPRGVKAKAKFSTLPKLDKLDFVDSVWIESIESATKIIEEGVCADKYFCVKMTVIIEIEGISSKKQKIEERFVLIKAKSSDDAYEKLDKQKGEYSQPYLNSDGRFVRWRIESFNDCFETDIDNPNDLNRVEGVEVYSKLKSRKTNKKTVWDGKFYDE